MAIGEVKSLLVDDLNKFVFVVVLRAYRLFLSYFLYKYILNWLFAFHIVTYSGICSYTNNKSSFIAKIKSNRCKLMLCTRP